MPWIRDEFGNPMILSWEDTFTSAGDFLGLSGIYNKAGAYMLGHGNEDLLLANIFPQGWDRAQQTFANATAPWIRSALDKGYRTKYQTVGERAESIERSISRAFIPGRDAMRLLGKGDKDESDVGEVLGALGPVIRFIDLSEGVPLSKANVQFEAGRIQREAAQASSQIEKHMDRFTAGLKKGDAKQMARAVEQVWAEVGPNMAEMGQSQAHLWARMIRASLQEVKEDMILDSGGMLPPKFFQLSRTQQAELLMRLSK